MNKGSIFQFRKIWWPDATRRRAGAQVAEVVSFRPVRDEINRRRRLLVDEDAARVDAFALPQLEEHAPELVVADARHVGGARAAACGGDDHVGGIAPEALQECLFGRSSLVELDHRLAYGNDHFMNCLAWAMTRRRSSAASARWSRMLLPMPTMTA